MEATFYGHSLQKLVLIRLFQLLTDYLIIFGNFLGCNATLDIDPITNGLCKVEYNIKSLRHYTRLAIEIVRLYID